MDLKSLKKLTLTVNTVILIIVFGLAGFFAFCGATFLVWFSIPTAMIYIIGYVLIKKERLDIYVRMVYFWLTLYMSVTTICLGYRMGFHLYCLSMIPIIFYTEYMAEKIKKSKVNAVVISGIIVLCYVVATGYSAFNGPIYDVSNEIAGAFWLLNSAIVLYFLIVYSGIMLKMVGDYENRLTTIAHTDRLTGLYNRHFMMTKLEETVKEGKKIFVTMSDIDNFKQINDHYGHNAGDYVLSTLSQLMKENCSNSEISRWGGEEFLILSEGEVSKNGFEMIENLRKVIEGHDFVFENEKIDVTITSGIADYRNGQSVDAWIKEADEKLYIGKNSGKNKVVITLEK